MPLYLDRHDVPGSTPEDVARAHVQDLAVQGKYDVLLLSYWFDPDAEQVFCLAQTTAKENLVAVHRESHGLIPNEIIEVNEGDVLRFMGMIKDPPNAASATSPFRTILFTDLIGSTALTERLGDHGFMEFLDRHNVIVRKALAASSGREVKHTGDGIMASFDSVPHAVTCSIAIQRGFDAYNEQEPSEELRVRIGLAAGEPVASNDDLFGSTVNLASRICEAALPEQILTAALVHEKAGDGTFSFEEAGRRELKGFSRPVEVFAVEWREGSASPG